MDAKTLVNEVVNKGICTGCGACVAMVVEGEAKMITTNNGVEPLFSTGCKLSDFAWESCPGKGVDYPWLYRQHFGKTPGNWKLGHVDTMWTAYASENTIRQKAASGGVLSSVLIHLLESGKVDAVVVAKQGEPTPVEARWRIARSKLEVLDCAQSVYVPLSMLDAMKSFIPGERYAMTCLPEQSAALRVMQRSGHAKANQIAYVLGPYTGTALEPGAIRALLRSHGVPDDDEIKRLRWREGDWPGYLEIHTGSERVIRSKKVYYNFLIPFYVTQTSLQSMDFANEFTDLSAGDAWSPRFEAKKEGVSAIIARTPEMTQILLDMKSSGLLNLEMINETDAEAMHGHMIDFKKRGSYLRNRWRNFTRRSAPDYGLQPQVIGLSRMIVEMVIATLFGIGRTRMARWIPEIIPEKIIGPFFNQLRLAWKAASKPAKRNGLNALKMIEHVPKWKVGQR